jgi:hypothetical protein
MNNKVDGIRLGEFCQFKKEIRRSQVYLFVGLGISKVDIHHNLKSVDSNSNGLRLKRINKINYYISLLVNEKKMSPRI